jgi:hypothetical protein
VDKKSEKMVETIRRKILLRRTNRFKSCLNCGCTVEIVMVGNDGFCPNETSEHTGKYLNKLYTIDTRGSEHGKN